MKYNRLILNKLLISIIIISIFVLMGCTETEINFVEAKGIIDENGNLTQMFMKGSFSVNKTEIDVMLSDVDEEYFDTESSEWLGTTLSEWNSLSETEQVEFFFRAAIREGGFGDTVLKDIEVSQAGTKYIILLSMIETPNAEVKDFIFNGDEVTFTVDEKSFSDLGDISSEKPGVYIQVVYFLPYQIKTLETNLEHELLDGGVRVKFDDPSLIPFLNITMDRTKLVGNLDEKFNSYDGESAASKPVKQETKSEEESEDSSLIDWTYDNFGGVLELLPGDRKTKFYIFAAAVVFIVLKLFSGSKKE